MFRVFFIVLCLFLANITFAQSYVKPDCYGGKTQFKRLFQREVLYPDSAWANDEEGEVVLVFVVSEIGTIKNLRVWKSAGKHLDNEAKRIFKKLLWKPGSYRGEPKAFEHFQSFKFSKARYLKICKKRGYTEPPYPFTPIDSSNSIYDRQIVDQEPLLTFPDGSSSLNQYLANNLQYPKAAQRHSISGVVKLYFVVEQSGRISNIKVIKDLGGGCNGEAIRLLEGINWKPGVKDNKAVRTAMTISMVFLLPDNTDYHYVPNAGGGSIN